MSTDYKEKTQKDRKITYKRQYNYLFHVFKFYTHGQLQGQQWKADGHFLRAVLYSSGSKLG